MLNKVIIQGRMVEDPQIKTTSGGLQIAEFSIANDEFVKGEKRTGFYNVTTFGKSSDFAQKHLAKGARVDIEGKLRHEKWINQDGENRQKVTILAERIHPIDWKNQEGNKNPGNNTPSNASNGNNQPDDFNYPELNDDIPF
jgi:single-strand DNA-binding protein